MAGSDVDEIGFEPDEDQNFVAPPQKTVEELMKLDAEDESLRRWKESLGLCMVEPSDGPQLEIHSFVFDFEDHPSLIIDVSSEEARAKLATQTFIIKENTPYSFKIRATVRNLVYSLWYRQVVRRIGILIQDKSFPVGSFGPKKEVQDLLVMKNESPGGLAGRGEYKISSRVYQVENKNSPYVEVEWKLKVTTEWDNK